MTVFIALCLALTLVAAHASAASAACKVTNTTRGSTYKGLADAVKAAGNGNTFVVRGTCFGTTEISNKRLTIVGKWTRKHGAPILRGDGRQPVLKIGGDVTKVTLKKLTIEAKPDQVLRRGGGGIRNVISTLVLQDVRVKGFTTREGGGGIADFEGTIRLLGTTKVVNNESTQGSGGGILNNSGTVVLRDHALVAFNTAREGGGISSAGSGAAVVLKGTASVRGNTTTAADGGGVQGGYGAVTLSGNASISGNTSFQDGGAVGLAPDEGAATAGSGLQLDAARAAMVGWMTSARSCAVPIRATASRSSITTIIIPSGDRVSESIRRNQAKLGRAQRAAWSPGRPRPRPVPTPGQRRPQGRR